MSPPTHAALNQVYLSLGSNIHPEDNLIAAAQQLARHGRVSAASPVWETKPLGGREQPNYLNAVLLLETPLGARTLKEGPIADIEARLGRIRTHNRFAPRTIDIDILLFNRDILSLGQQVIPSPEILERPFVALPLAEIAPQFIHPQTGQTMTEIAQSFGEVLDTMRPRPEIVLPVTKT